MKKPDEQQRNAERIPLKAPVNGTIDAAEAQITELSLIGAKVEHFNRLSMNSTATLQFRFGKEMIKLKGKVARTEMRAIRGKPGYLSGITFANSIEDAPPELRRIMASFVKPVEAEEELPPFSPPPPSPPPPPKPAARPATAAPPPRPAPAAKKPAPTPLPIPAPFLQEADDEVEEIDAAAEVPLYVLCVYLDDGGWQTTRTNDPKQPLSGFTMLAPDSDEEVDDFCRTYEMADPETQRMIRLSFELSIAQHRKK